jgi:error-prone DNA polymerase
VNHSEWDNMLEQSPDGSLALRLGFRQMDGFREDWATAIFAHGPFTSVEDLSRRADLPRRALQILADADAFRSIGLGRRDALWEVRRTPKGILPLFEAAKARELAAEADRPLPAMTAAEHVVTDYQTTRLSLKGHPMQFLRAQFRERGILSCADVAAAKNGSIVEVTGVVLIRQRPGKGNAIFVTLEDESGIANILIWARVFETGFRRPVMASRLMKVRGEMQKSKEGVIHIIANHIEDYTHFLDRIAQDSREHNMRSAAEIASGAPSTRGHPRNRRILPGSRDFH